MSEIKIRKEPNEDVVQIALINLDGEGLTIGMPEENFRTLFSAMQKAIAQLNGENKRKRELCSKCHGNGVIRLPNGVEECSRCHGDCWEPKR